METTCQASNPLNSENASPPGTVRVYLSCCAKAKLPNTASATAMAAPAAADGAITLRRIGNECVLDMIILPRLGCTKVNHRRTSMTYARRRGHCPVGVRAGCAPYPETSFQHTYRKMTR